MMSVRRLFWKKERLGQDEEEEKVAREDPWSLKSWVRSRYMGGQGLGERC